MSSHSLLNPPTSIQVGNVIDVDSNHISTEVETNKDHASLFGRESETTDYNVTVNTTIGSPDIDRVIRDFQQELDTLSRSFDRLATSRSHTKRPLASASASASTGKSPTTAHGTDTPANYHEPSNRNEYGSRSTKKTNYSMGDNPADETETFRTHTTSRFDPPRPVDTPIVSTSTAGTTSRYDVGDDQYLGKSDSLEDVIKRMRESLHDQNYTIRQMQRENNDLRRQLLLAQGDPKMYKGKQQRQNNSRREPMFDGINRPRNLDTRYDRTHHPERFYDEMRPTVSSLSTFRSTQLSTPPRDEDENTTLETAPRVGALHTGFTPGTKFVAELTKFMTIDHGHNVPLSVIIDKHWDKLKVHMREDTNNDY